MTIETEYCQSCALHATSAHRHVPVSGLHNLSSFVVSGRGLDSRQLLSRNPITPADTAFRLHLGRHNHYLHPLASEVEWNVGSHRAETPHY